MTDQQKCASCPQPAVIQVNWFNRFSGTTQADRVCKDCVDIIWKRLQESFAGTSAFDTFSVTPLVNPEIQP